MATSELERGELMEDGVPEELIRVPMNGLTIPPGGLPRRGNIRARFGISMAVPLVLALGRIARKKGLVDVIRALAGLSRVHVLIVGPDSGDGTLQEIDRASRMIGGRVHVDTRGLWGADKLSAYADADCFVLPSRTENFGNAAAEATGIGVPVVVSNACGVAEVLDRTAHRVVEPGNVGELVQAIADLITPAARAKAVAGADGVRSKLDWAVLSRDQLDIYLDAVGG